ncbi:nucleoporin SEH1-A-like isoform X1 [Vespa mandarinia]|uniref:nucleoporin SEH1-A-like isoform X1 n=1 Tax=Vespa mandarinia TaxID=7446 RepID=UPI00160CAB53|nr:nucleoporin SEH1-A-like isoform X1 [Vespa mandarinia]XP_047367504.1 nucleoporin SEH1-A isoform X1 [Vespa velutina]
MFEAHSINAEHKDLIHDIAYDFYGQRMATCSSDQFVKVWDEDEHGNWHLTASWKAHSGSVWKVTWAHPEFGQVLATCSFDRTAAVWEEIVEGSGSGERGMRHWVRRTNLVDSRTSVTDVKFAPKMLGLLLITCSADGVIRIYEAPDIMNLSQWTLQHDISCKLPCSCLTWNPSLSRLHPPMIAVGSDDTNSSSGGKVFIYEYSEGSRRWTKTETLSNITDPVHDIAFAPNLGRSFHTLAVATKDVRIIILKPMQESAQNGLSRFEITTAAQFDDHYTTVWHVCWNIMGTILASSGDDGCVRLWKDNYINNWKCVAVLKGDGTSAQNAETPAAATPPNQPTGIPPPSTAKYYKLGSISHPNQVVTTATITAEKPTTTIMCNNKWQAPVIKGRFSKSVWLGNPGESSLPPLPLLERPKVKK